MKLKDFLEKNKIINLAQLASLMWPNNKSARSRLTNKLNENPSGSGRQRITEKDLLNAKKVLKDLCNDIDKLEY